MASSCLWVWFQPPSTWLPSIAPAAPPTGTPIQRPSPRDKAAPAALPRSPRTLPSMQLCHQLLESWMNVQALRACEQKDLNGTGFQPFRSNSEHVLACLVCRGHIPLGTHRESTVNLWRIPADTSFQRRAALQPTTKVAEPIEQRSSVSQQHIDD